MCWRRQSYHCFHRGDWYCLTPQLGLDISQPHSSHNKSPKTPHKSPPLVLQWKNMQSLSCIVEGCFCFHPPETKLNGGEGGGERIAVWNEGSDVNMANRSRAFFSFPHQEAFIFEPIKHDLTIIAFASLWTRPHFKWGFCSPFHKAWFSFSLSCNVREQQPFVFIVSKMVYHKLIRAVQEVNLYKCSFSKNGLC